MSSPSCGRHGAVRTSDARGRDRGFALIELIVVLVILGLALSLVLAQGPARSPTVAFDSAVRQVAGALRLARSRAITDDRMVAVLFAADGFRLDRDAAIAFAPDISLSGSRLIDFTPDGASSGGKVMLQMGGRQTVIGVDWLTGRVELAERG